MSFAKLQGRVWRVNQDLSKTGLVVLTWGNASGVDRSAGVMAIKPSGVPYAQLKPNDLVVLSLETGKVVAGKGRPSSDTPTHLHLYRSFPGIGGVVHTHSLHATSLAQAGRELPCLGTTHADYFHGPVPVTRQLTAQEVAEAYELNAGKVIVECFHERKLDPLHVPGVLLAGHAPFTWGETPEQALENAVVLEFAAQMALHTWRLNPDATAIPQYLLDKHFLRKHGPGAYYGQPQP
jgi:L-ribulose-5-phosphate 4-epimerase